MPSRDRAGRIHGVSTERQIADYIDGQPPAKRDDMRALHQRILGLSPGSRLWFLDGRNQDGKIVSNPNIGYGLQRIDHAGGKARDFYRVGLSANTTGLSVYIIGIDDKTYLARTYGARLGKASATGYCIKFRSLKDIDVEVLEEAIRFGFGDRERETNAEEE
jgi:hypothetical protein